ncbi:MAG: PhoH family protein [Nanoarchaeota archaeon]|nr:PhoH family protein [Nanoarchaeota archaeon]
MATSKTYFLDTSMLVADPDCIYEFGDKPSNTVVICDVVMAELDHLKDKTSDIRPNVRGAINRIARHIEYNPHCYEPGGASLGRGKGKLRIYSDNPRMVEFLQKGGHATVGALEGITAKATGEPDNRMIFVPPQIDEMDIALVREALNYRHTHGDGKFVFMTRDNSLSSTARINGLTTEYKRSETVDPNALHRGYTLFDDAALYSDLVASNVQPHLRSMKVSKIDEPWAKELIANQFVIFNDPNRQEDLVHFGKINRETIFRYDIQRNMLFGIPRDYTPVLGDIKPKNFPQALLIELMRSGVSGIAVSGGAGAGKTYLPLALAIEKINQGVEKAKTAPVGTIYMTKRDVKVAGEDLGWAPGERENKLKLWGMITNYKKLARKAHIAETWGNTLDAAMKGDDALCQLMPIGEIRGLSLSDEDIFMIEDGQNLEYTTIKAATSRNGRGMFVVNGDCNQEDNPHPYMSASNNGLTRLMHAVIQASYYAKNLKPEQHQGIDRYFRRKASKLRQRDIMEFAKSWGIMFLPKPVRGPLNRFSVEWL